MTARIYSPVKTAMQSGSAKTGYWVLEFIPETPRKVEPLMGYTSSADTKTQIRMKFPSKEAAVEYALREGIPYILTPEREKRRRSATYAENFSFGRRQPWTH
ncbi:MAG: ETC complex I subunit [Nitratireductor sp.]|jgi:uncharacterized protein YbaR (Trm112 family)|nr:ETC complex I subunit [Nitratireductor sp.]MCC0019760.1 ETC complex I subunit [Nitratireductor sp.]